MAYAGTTDSTHGYWTIDTTLGYGGIPYTGAAGTTRLSSEANTQEVRALAPVSQAAHGWNVNLPSTFSFPEPEMDQCNRQLSCLQVGFPPLEMYGRDGTSFVEYR